MSDPRCIHRVYNYKYNVRLLMVLFEKEWCSTTCVLLYCYHAQLLHFLSLLAFIKGLFSGLYVYSHCMLKVIFLQTCLLHSHAHTVHFSPNAWVVLYSKCMNIEEL